MHSSRHLHHSLEPRRVGCRAHSQWRVWIRSPSATWRRAKRTTRNDPLPWWWSASKRTYNWGIKNCIKNCDNNRGCEEMKICMINKLRHLVVDLLPILKYLVRFCNIFFNLFLKHTKWSNLFAWQRKQKT